MSFLRLATLICLISLAALCAAFAADAPAKKPAPGGPTAKTYTDSTTGMEFVWVEGGCFRMGSPETHEEKFDDEVPHHEVCVDGFYIGKYEVTQQQWTKVMVDNPSTFSGKNLPVENVTFRDATVFAKKLSQLSGKNFDLPTEAEWEFASQGGKESKGLTYAGSNDIEEVAWYNTNSGRATHPVGQKKPNELGIHDMSGNVTEWCRDWYFHGYYAVSPKDNPTGPSGGKERVLRGGSWQMGANRCRTENREYAIAMGYLDDIGFRLVMRK